MFLNWLSEQHMSFQPTPSDPFLLLLAQLKTALVHPQVDAAYEAVRKRTQRLERQRDLTRTQVSHAQIEIDESTDTMEALRHFREMTAKLKAVKAELVLARAEFGKACEETRNTPWAAMNAICSWLCVHKALPDLPPHIRGLAAQLREAAIEERNLKQDVFSTVATAARRSLDTALEDEKTSDEQRFALVEAAKLAAAEDVAARNRQLVNDDYLRELRNRFQVAVLHEPSILSLGTEGPRGEAPLKVTV